MGTSLVVLGMHPSGASALAVALEQCGALAEAREGLQALRDDLHQDAARGNDDGAHGFPGTVFIHVTRHPLEVARALQADRGFAIAEGLALWEVYHTSALRASEGRARTLVSYGELVARPRERLGRLLEELRGLGVQGLEPPGSQTLEALSTLGPDHGTDGAAHLLTSSQKELWERLSLGGLDGGTDWYETHGEALERALRVRAAQVAELRAKTKEQENEIGVLDQRVAWLDAQVMELQSSTSWRITAPLRSVSTAVRRISARLGGKPGRGQEPSTQTRPDAANAWVRPPAALEGEDTFVLYRIIGNDLHPRHKRGQAIGNLRFILEHEPAFEDCEKRFVVNRILAADQEREIIGLLDRAGFEYLRIPFDAEEYAGTGFDTDCLPEPGFLAGERFEALDDAGKGRLLAALYRHKNNYVMNNNGARNAALEDGRSRAKWILPWDGNCFLTRDAWERIRRDIADAPENRYFIVPMARMASNDPLISGGKIPKAVEEPQVIFRADAAERFNEAFCYGRRPKVELLWRLGVRGPWDDYPDDPWDQARAPVSPDASAVGRAGWVARLSSGMTTLEASSDQAPLHRGLARTGAILATLQRLDAGLAGVDPEEPVSLRAGVLRQEVENQGNPPLREIVRALKQAADQALADDGKATLQAGLADSMVLALAWSFTGAPRYAKQGAGILARFFINPQTRVAPHLASDDGLDAGASRAMHYYLDAVRLFERTGSIPEAARGGFRTWLASRLRWLSTSREAAAERQADDHRGTFHDLEMASIASFLDDQDAVSSSLVRAQARIGVQFVRDGSQPGEAGRPGTAHRCCLNFQGWIHLAELASRWGVDLWGYQAPDGSGLAQGARWLLSHMEGAWPDGGDEGFDAQRLQPIWFAAREHVNGLSGHGGPLASPYLVKPVFTPEAGVRPFWSLASHGQGPG